MIYTNMNTPSKNMRLSNTELSKMLEEQQNELYYNERKSHIQEQAKYDRDRESYYNQMQDYLNEQIQSSNNRSQFLQNVKESFLTECIMKLYSESMLIPMNKSDKVVARNLVTRFIRENGAGDLISKFATKNLLLSEFARVTQKYYDKVVELCESNNINPKCDTCCDVKEYDLPKVIVDDFYKELADVDVLDASKLIKDRVADAITEFIDSNSSAKMDYEEVIKQAQDNIATAKDESMVEEYSNTARRRINEMKLVREKNIFNIMVEALTRKVITDDSYKKKYMHEATVDMDSVVDSTRLIYTMLEMVNTTNMVNVNEEFIARYLGSLA